MSFGIYQIKGIILYLTFFMYSGYPFRPSARTFSSLFIRFWMIGRYTNVMMNDGIDPNISGMERNRRRVAEYIG